MAVTHNAIMAVESRSTPGNLTIFTIDGTSCKASLKTYSGIAGAREPQDMAVGSDGTLWVADIGDPDATRTSVGFERVASGANTATISRVKYPDGAKTAKGFVLDGDDTPIIFAVVDGQPGAAIYKPASALVPNVQCPGCPALVAVTGHEEPRYQAEAAAAGFCLYFTKPVDLDILETLLQSLARAQGELVLTGVTGGGPMNRPGGSCTYVSANVRVAPALGMRARMRSRCWAPGTAL